MFVLFINIISVVSFSIQQFTKSLHVITAFSRLILIRICIELHLMYCFHMLQVTIYEIWGLISIFEKVALLSFRELPGFKMIQNFYEKQVNSWALFCTENWHLCDLWNHIYALGGELGLKVSMWLYYVKSRCSNGTFVPVTSGPFSSKITKTERKVFIIKNIIAYN